MIDSTPSSSDHSVFISYARADNEPPDSETKGWVSFFWDQLRYELTDRGAAEAKLWLDRYQIDPQHQQVTWRSLPLRLPRMNAALH
jgi:hypothetical protein